MRFRLSLFLAAFVALSGCDATTPSEPAASSSDEIMAAHAAAASSTTCTAPSLAFGAVTGWGTNTVIATPANSSTDVSVTIYEKTNIYNETWEPVFGAAYNGSSVTYATDWGPSHPRSGYYASYRATSLCPNGFTSGYSNTITSWVAP